MPMPTSPTRLTAENNVWRAPNDTLQDHWIQGLGGDDELSGFGAGTVKLDGGMGHDRIYGSNGNDTLYGGAGADTLDGGDGNDRLVGGAGHDALSGGSGDDRIYGDVASTPTAENFADSDLIDGGEGYDTLVLERATDASISHASGITSIERFYGSLSNDALDFSNYSTAIDPVTSIGTGGVNAYARGGDDKVVGTIHADRIDGGEGADWLEGGAGNDTLIAGSGQDSMFGGDGDDTFYVSHEYQGRNDAFDQVVGGAGYDTLRVTKGAVWFETYNEAVGVERFVGGTGNDNLNLSGYWSGNDAVKPLDSASANGVRVDGGDGFDGITGTSYADKLYGGNGDDYLNGGAGNDTINGGNGHDFLFGGEGNDVLVAGPANLNYAPGEYQQDVLTGGAGNDRFDLRKMVGGLLNGNDVIIQDFVKGEDVVDLRGLGLGDVGSMWTLQGSNPNSVRTTICLDGDPNADPTLYYTGRFVTFVGIAAADITSDMILT